MMKKINRSHITLFTLLFSLFVCGCGNDKRNGRELFPIEKNGEWGYIDNSGTITIKPQFDRANPFYEGMAMVRQHGKCGYINEQGDMVVTPQFDNADRFSEGLACVWIGGSWGYINKKGKYVINPLFNGGAGHFSECERWLQMGLY